MRSSFASRGGFTLTRTPNVRRQASRRRLAILGGFVGLAAASALVGATVHPDPVRASGATTGPFSYIPTE